MAVKKSRKQVLVSDLFIFKRRCIYRDTETTVILSEFTCKIVFTKKKNSLNPNWRNNGELLKQSVTFGPQKKIFCLKHGSEMNGNRALLVRLIWLVWWNLCELQVHKSYDRVNLLYCNCQWMALKQDSLHFVLCPKQGLYFRTFFVLNKVRVLNPQ